MTRIKKSDDDYTQKIDAISSYMFTCTACVTTEKQGEIGVKGFEYFLSMFGSSSFVDLFLILVLLFVANFEKVLQCQNDLSCPLSLDNYAQLLLFRTIYKFRWYK